MVIALAGGILAFGGYAIGFDRGRATAPTAHLVEAEQVKRDALWDEAFLADLDRTPTEREAFCDGVIEGAADLLHSEAMAER